MLARSVVAVPELAVAAVAGFSIGPMVLLLAGHFDRGPVLLTGAVGAILAAIACGLRDGARQSPAPWSAVLPPASPRTDLWATVAALVLVIAWVLLNARYTAENVYATRDPATYNLAARWLMDHPSLHISVHSEIFGNPPGYTSQSPGFSDVSEPAVSGQLYSQGNHLAPALAAVVGWLAGVSGMFRANVVLGAFALLALFTLARRVIGSPLALVVTAAMAVSMPMIYVSRDMYSEPLMMLFLVGGAAMMHRAVNSRRRVDFALAGLVAGCSAMVRIDSYLALVAIGVSAVALVCLAGIGERRATIKDVLALLAAGAVPILVGWLDVTRLSSGYYRDQHHNIMTEFLALACVVVLAPVAVWIAWRPAARAWLGSERVRARIASGAVVLLVAVFLMLLSRPLWMVGRYPFDNHTLVIWQKLSGVAPDGTRSYRERTVLWLGQYFGWPTVILGVVGYSILIVALIRRRAYPLIGMLTLGLAMTALYLWDAEITGDQPWAIRRYVPVVLPVLLIAVGAVLRPLAARGRAGITATVVLAALVIGIPAHVMWPMRHARDEVPQYSQVQAMCSAMGRDGAVVSVDLEAYNVYGQTMRSYCGVPSIGLVGATAAQLQTMRDEVAKSHRTLYVMAKDGASVRFAPGVARGAFSTVNTQLWPNTINFPPRLPVYRETPIWLNRVGSDGLAVPVG